MMYIMSKQLEGLKNDISEDDKLIRLDDTPKELNLGDRTIKLWKLLNTEDLASGVRTELYGMDMDDFVKFEEDDGIC